MPTHRPTDSGGTSVLPLSGKHIVTIGCGFGGLEAAQALRGARVDGLAVPGTVIDRANHHLCQPLLYQVATAGLSAPSIAAPIRHILRKSSNTTLLMDEVIGIDTAAKRVLTLSGANIGYDTLIVAAWATHSYFAHPEWAAHAPGLKALADAMALRERMLVAFEQAERRAAAGERVEPLNFVVIGAGPTGVEMAGTLAEIAQHTLKDQFRHTQPARSQVWLIEGGPRVLPSFSEALSAKAQRQLESLGVSPGAKKAGRFAARNALAQLQGKPLKPFRYIDYGSLATMGRKAAVVQLGPIQFWGFAAWAFWLFVHMYFLIGFRHRFVVLMEWAWAYLSFGRSARVAASGVTASAKPKASS